MVNALRQLQLDDLCVHQVSLSGQCDFANSLAVLRNAGIKRTALWTPMIKSCGISEAKRIWDSAGMTAESICVACLFEDEALLREQLDLANVRLLLRHARGSPELLLHRHLPLVHRH